MRDIERQRDEMSEGAIADLLWEGCPHAEPACLRGWAPVEEQVDCAVAGTEAGEGSSLRATQPER